MRQYGAAPKEDIKELWRRIAFSILISNTDDRLRNHSFLYEGPQGWRLAMAHHLNPVPFDIKPRVLTTTINVDDGTALIDLALEVPNYLGWIRKRTKIAGELAAVIGKRLNIAAGLRLIKTEIDRWRHRST